MSVYGGVLRRGIFYVVRILSVGVMCLFPGFR